MKIIIIFILILLFSFDAQSQYFSGHITYKTEVTINNTDYEYSEYQKAKYGDSLLVTIDNSGKLRYDYINTGNPGFEFMYLDPESKLNVYKFTYSDTLFLVNKNDETTHLMKIDTLKNETILDRDCEVYQIIILEIEGEMSQYWTTTYWIDRNLKLNKELYQDWKESYWDIISSFNGGMFIKMTQTNNFMTVDFEAVKIENIEPIELIFEYDSSKAIIFD